MSAEPVSSRGPVRREVPSSTGNPILPPQHSLLRSAWLAVALGLAIEGVVLASIALSGGALAAKPVTADLVQKVSWSVIVCVALAVARTAATASGPLMGLAGLLAAPAGFAIARGLHKGASQALGLAAVAAAVPPPVLVASLKGVEYAALGLAIGWVSRRSWGGVGVHAAVGLAAGLFFGIPLLVLTVQAAPQMAASALAARAVNELLFPVGCALVLYASDSLGKRLV